MCLFIGNGAMTVEQLSAVTNVSRVHLTRAFNRAQGIAPHAYLNTLRINAAKKT